MSRYKSTKKRSKLERLLRQDHSDVYFDNDKLNDQLLIKIDELKREKYRHDLEHETEIFELRKEYRKLILQKNEDDDDEEEEDIYRPTRPHTVTGTAAREPTPSGIPSSAGRQRVKSAWPKVTFTEPPPRAPSPTWSESSLRNPVTLRKYKNIGSHSFKEKNKYPAEWYVRCLEASDAAIYNSRRKKRGKSAPPVFTFLSMLRDREETQRKIESYKRIKQQGTKQEVVFRDFVGEDEEPKKMPLVCDQPVKPIVMSRRKLMEITNVNKVPDRGPSRNTMRKQNFKILNEQDKTKINVRVKDFCKSLIDLKKRLESEEKEREERKKRERQEQEYMSNISLDQLTAPPVKEPESDSDSDTPRFISRRIKRK